ncbi:tautomerase family protein [Streptomyces sp. NP160]|uniref:tautomerase family protein n=1 Tax=Streptomyces sp. NP160 TaxID=2586637 RepID=UPI00111979D2|nr:tautomerase family protein [Streptomyces sp. NP160]TNM69929.1 tautomerase family protein [Streptomyces sp. NP160]
MAQFKVHGRDTFLREVRQQLSDVLHAAAVDVLELPVTKRFHRFFPMAAEDFPTPEGRTERYLVVEVLMFEGRSVATKKAFYARLYRDVAALGVEPADLEVTIVETPRHDWAVRGLPGDELALPYRVDV